MTFPAELASLLLEGLGIQGKPDLSSVAHRIGLRIREMDAQGFDGTLVRALEGAKGIIGVKQSIREFSRKRFTIAHEIGHYVIPSHRKLENVCTSKMVESWREGLYKPEIEANEFAAEFLLPGRFVREPLKLKNPSMRTISIVASAFETSLTATARRFADLTDLPCVVIWSQRKRVKWYRRSKSMPFYLPKESLPSEGSFAYKLFSRKLVPDDFAEVRPEAWLDRRDAERVAHLLEHSIPMTDYGAVLTFLWFELRYMPDESEDSTLDELAPEDFTLRRKRWPR